MEHPAIAILCSGIILRIRAGDREGAAIACGTLHIL
jgi:hypothetical protein